MAYVEPLKRQLTDPSLAQFMNAFELLRQMDREIPGQLVSTFLYIASHSPCHKQAIEEDLNLKSAAGSRLTDRLSDHHRHGKSGLGLVRKYQDPSNHRRVLVELTPKGEALVQQMKSAASF